MKIYIISYDEVELVTTQKQRILDELPVWQKPFTITVWENEICLQQIDVNDNSNMANIADALIQDIHTNIFS